MRLLPSCLALLAAACASTLPIDDTPQSLRIVSWNLEHLAEANGSGCRPRQEEDYAALRAFADRLDADIIAFQEVESASAAARVFDPAIYEIVIEARQGSPSRLECRGLEGRFLNRQAVGFAIRKGVAFERQEDLTALQLADPDLRSAVDIEVHPVGRPAIRLLAVHLKSGCASGASNEACETLFRQAPILEDWIDDRARASDRFVVLGDFNRRLAHANDRVWTELDDNEPQGADLVYAAGDTGARCDPRYPDFIDHIVIPHTLVPSAFQEWTFQGEHLSDHCPVSIDMGS